MKSLDFQGFFCIILCFSILLKFLQSLSYYSVFYYFLIPFFIIYCSISYRHRSFTTSPAMISPATDGTNAVLPGISLLSVHLRAAPGGQIQCVLQLIDISSIGVRAFSLEYTTFRLSTLRFFNSRRMTFASGQTDVS